LHPKNPIQMNRLYRVDGVKNYYVPPQPWAIPGKGKPPLYTGQGMIVGVAPSVRSGWWQRLRSRMLP
jgi:hypothetical protein